MLFKEKRNKKKEVRYNELLKMINSMNYEIKGLKNDLEKQDQRIVETEKIINNAIESKKLFRINNDIFTARAYNCLRRAGIEYFEDFKDISIKQLRRIRNLGNVVQNEIVYKVHQLGFKFKDDYCDDE